MYQISKKTTIQIPITCYVIYLTRRRTLVHGAYIGALHQPVPVTFGIALFVADDFYVGLL